MKKKSSVVKLISVILAFFIACGMVTVSLCLILQSTLFSGAYVMDSMLSGGYFSDAEYEVKQDLSELCYTSGLDEDFFDNLFDEVFLKAESEKYVSNCFSDVGDVSLSTKSFEELFTNALDGYARDGGVQNISEQMRARLVTEAAEIYRADMEIPVLETLGSLAGTYRGAVYVILAVCGVVIIAAFVTILLINKWRHRFLRNISYGCLAAFITMFILPVVGFLSGISTAALFSRRSLCLLYTEAVNGVLLGMFLLSGILLLVSLIFLLLYSKSYRKDM